MREKPPWLIIAEQYIGLREIPGEPTAPIIARWLQQLGAWWNDDETPWCGVAMAAWMQEAGIVVPDAWYRAKAWTTWGVPLEAPSLGCVVVFTRKGGGHVGLVVGTDQQGRLLVLGGNQGDAVSVAAFSTERVIAYRWPDDISLLATSSLPIDDAPVSAKEN
jgi:uncharacterized protein (TIGR02594 family)